jgi:hypothetical protein
MVLNQATLSDYTTKDVSVHKVISLNFQCISEQDLMEME